MCVSGAASEECQESGNRTAGQWYSRGGGWEDWADVLLGHSGRSWRWPSLHIIWQLAKCYPLRYIYYSCCVEDGYTASSNLLVAATATADLLLGHIFKRCCAALTCDCQPS